MGNYIIPEKNCQGSINNRCNILHMIKSKHVCSAHMSQFLEDPVQYTIWINSRMFDILLKYVHIIIIKSLIKETKENHKKGL